MPGKAAYRDCKLKSWVISESTDPSPNGDGARTGYERPKPMLRMQLVFRSSTCWIGKSHSTGSPVGCDLEKPILGMTKDG